MKILLQTGIGLIDRQFPIANNVSGEGDVWQRQSRNQFTESKQGFDKFVLSHQLSRHASACEIKVPVSRDTRDAGLTRLRLPFDCSLVNEAPLTVY